MALVFAFDFPHAAPPREMTDVLGEKGASLAEMTSVLGLPVPPGFTITTAACRGYPEHGWSAELDALVAEHVARLERDTGRRLGDPDDPLLLSVRAGAPSPQAGIVKTVLNLGLNDRCVEGLAERSGDERFALDCYRRFVELYGRIVLGVPGEHFERQLAAVREAAGVRSDAELPASALAGIVAGLRRAVEQHTGEPFPDDPAVQLRGAIEAVFRSWYAPGALRRRRREGVDDDPGTAVNVQVMVFGNLDERSGTGVGSTRNPSTGEAVPQGAFLVNAQGREVLDGAREPLSLSEMAGRFPSQHAQLLEIFDRLERHYRDLLDTEFTIEHGTLWMLQVREGERTGAAALRIAVDLTTDPRIGLSRSEAILRVRPEHLEEVLHPHFERTRAVLLGSGVAASPGAAVGRAYFDPDRAADAADRGERVVLVRQETSPEDVHGMIVAEGILTSRGGLASHAAVVARGWGKPAVCGAESLTVHEDAFTTADGTTVREGEVISIDGSTGSVYLGAVTLVEGEPPPQLDVLLGWADELRAGRLGVRANADTREDAVRARAFGAEGIGLCRTEHLFLGERLPVVRRMLLADGPEQEAAALEELLSVQRADLLEVLEVMDGLPVTLRLLDPPLHEFLPSVEDLLVEQARGRLTVEDESLLTAAMRWREHNPMLGTRGVRLGILRAGLYRMQVRALVEAVLQRRDAGGDPRVEILIPLVSTTAELELVREWVLDELTQVAGARAAELDIAVGTMIETPRAALCADELAQHADFFSFGTNDLTQLTFGFSRDDVAPMLETYLEAGLLEVDPFASIDEQGVGELMRLGIERGRAGRPGLRIGVCGEHGGDPSSIAFFESLGVDYVSTSPFRVPVARLAAAQALVSSRGSRGTR
jgi:pyruvate,orthophosphate dikinase